MSVYKITYENGEVEIVEEGCEKDVWVEYGDMEIVKVECIGFKVNGEYV